MLWELFVAIGAVMFVIVPLQAARHNNAGIGGFAAAVSVGLIFAALYEVAAHKTADVLEHRLQQHSRTVQKWGYGIFSIATAVFPLFIAYVANTPRIAGVLRLR